MVSEIKNEGLTYTDYNTYDDYGHLSLTGGQTKSYQQKFQNSAGIDVISYTGPTANSMNTVDSIAVDGLGKVTKRIDPNTYVASGLSNLQTTENVGQNGTAAIIAYDVLGRVIETKTPVDKDENDDIIYSVKKTYYDVVGNVSKEINNESVKINTYDRLNNVVKVEQVISSTSSQFTQYFYDTKNRLVRVYTGLNKPLTINGLDNVSPNGDNDYSVIKYEYDFYGNKTSYTDAIGNVQIFSYNQFNGRLLSKEQHYMDSNNAYQQDYTISYEYDSSGNVTEVEGVKGTETITKTFTYYLNGKVHTAADENTTTTYAYDKLGNCTNISYTLDEKLYEIEYDYPVDKLTEVRTYIDGVRQSKKAFLFNTKKQLCNVIYYDINDTLISREGIGYDTNGNVKTRITAGGKGLIMQFSYNYQNMQTNLSAGVTGYTQVCEYSPDGNLTSKIEKSWGVTTATTNFTYDDLNRLKIEAYTVPNGADWSKNYSFDDYNNISSYAYTDNNDEDNDLTTSYIYDKANKITNQKSILADNSVYYDYKFSYDNAGNLANKVDDNIKDQNNQSKKLQEFTYDSMNRTKSITTYGTTTVTADFAYNANDQRLTKTVGSKTVTSMYEGSDIAMDVTVEGETTSKSIYFKALEQFGVMTDGVKYSFGADVKKDVNLAIDSQSIKTFNYDAYGTLFSHSGNDEPVSPYGYRGYYTDVETGLCYLNARYYDPSTQRFTQEDTFQNDNLQYNLYGYCSANPVMYVDPTGHGVSLAANATVKVRSNSYLGVRVNTTTTTEMGKVFNNERVRVN